MTASPGPVRGREWTGRKMLLTSVGAFGVIIAVNFGMAYKAVSTFPGLEVQNSYVASQTFDHDKRAQLALGWTVGAGIADGTLRLSINDPQGRPVRPVSVIGTLGRATEARDDMSPDFAFDGTAWTAPVGARSGYWNLRVEATAANGTVFRQRIEIYAEE